MLNEVFMAEKNASTTSSYRLQTDGVDIGKFRSSGVLVSTGTGSSGWLYGAKRVPYNVVHDVFEELIEESKDCETSSEQFEEAKAHSDDLHYLSKVSL